MSNPTQHFINVRIRNRDSERLKTACERLVSDLQGLGHGRRSGDEDDRFEFVGRIEVLEPNSTDHAYSGEVLSRSRFIYARRKRGTEFWVGVLAAVSGAVFLVMTLPPVTEALFSGMDPDWQLFIKGTFDRLATSAIVTATVSLLTVILYWFDLRRKSIVIWNV